MSEPQTLEELLAIPEIQEALKHRERRERRAELAKTWTKCCRCFPNSVGLESGFCSCCGYDNATKTTQPGWSEPDPDYFAEPPKETPWPGYCQHDDSSWCTEACRRPKETP